MATRYYFKRSSGGTNISGGYLGTPDAAWDFITDSQFRLLEAAKSADVSGNGARVTSMAPNGLACQFVSLPIGAQTISGTVKCQIKAREFASTDNVSSCIGIRVINDNGSVVRGTLLAVGNQSLATELIETSGHRNKKFAAAAALTPVASLNGDRLLVEIGFSHVGGTTPEGQCVFGSDNADDLPEDETSTAALDPWIEFSANIMGTNIVSFDPGQPGSGPLGIATTGVIRSGGAQFSKPPKDLHSRFRR